MLRRLLPPILTLLALLTALPVAAQAPVASPAATASDWRVAATRTLDIAARYPALSPDGALVAGVGPEHTICVWVVETLAASCADEELPIREETITWSPDGTAVAFALDAIRLGYESDIYVYEVQPGHLVNLTDDGVEGGIIDTAGSGAPSDDVPVWSPDSRQLAFARSLRDDESRSTTLMRIDRAGGDPVEILRLDVEEPYLVWLPMHWLPDGTLLYSQISARMDDPHNGVWKVGIDDGSSPLQVAPGAEGTDIPGPMITSVDAERGQAIVFSYFLAGQFGASADRPLFWLVDIATGERQPMPAIAAPDGETAVPLAATHAPDGGTILVTGLTDVGFRLWTVDPVTLAVAPIAGDPLDVALLPGAVLRWADDNSVLLQVAGGPVLVRLESSGPRGTPLPASPVASPAAGLPTGQLDARPLDLDAKGLALSPDGQWLAGVGPDSTPCFWDVATLTAKCADEKLRVLISEDYPTMAWAPDSSAVVFSLDAIGRLSDSDIYLFERESGALSDLTDDGYEGRWPSAPAEVPIDIMPSWSPDGEQVVFSRWLRSDAASSNAIMRVDRDGGEPVEITTPSLDEPLTIWMPIFWLPDDTIVYSVASTGQDQSLNGVWRVGIDGGEPVKAVDVDGGPGFSAALVADIAPVTGAVSVYWPRALVASAGALDQPLFWIGSLDEGSLSPIPPLDAATGSPLAARPEPGAIGALLPAAPAAFSPDGATALLTYRDADNRFSLATMDLASGTIAPLAPLPDGVYVYPIQPQWADDGTVLLQTGDGVMLLTLAPAA